MTKLLAGSVAVRRALPAKALLVVLVALSLGGCSIAHDFVLPGTFAYVKQAAEELDLDTAGEIQADGERGGGFWFGGDPTYVAIIAGPDAFSEIEARLADLGYQKTDTDFNSTDWHRGSDEKSLHVALEAVDPGDMVFFGEGESVSVNDAGISIVIRGTRVR